MMRVGEGALDEERPGAAVAGVIFEIGDRLLGDEGRGVEFFRHPRPPRLGRGVAAPGQRVGGAAQRIGIGMASGEPSRAMAVDSVAVEVGEARMAATVMGSVDLAPGVLDPEIRALALVFGADDAPPVGLAQGSRRRLAGAAQRVGRLVHRRRQHVLEAALAEERGAVAGRAQQIDEGHGLQRQREPVGEHAVDAGHPPGHQRLRFGMQIGQAT